MFESLNYLKQNEFTPKFSIFTPTWLISQQAIHSFKFQDFFSRVFRCMPGDFFCSYNRRKRVRNIVFLPVDLIKEADENGWLRSLAYYVRLKSLYKNNTHYNFSLRTLGERLKCSPACLSSHLKILYSHGLLRYHGKNITFLGLKKLEDKAGSYKKNVGVPVNSKNQYDILRGQILRFNLSAQQHSCRKSEIQIRTKGFVPFSRDEKMRSSYIGLSAEGLGWLWSVSKASGSRIRRKLQALGQIFCKRRYSRLLSNMTYQGYRILKNAGDIPAYSFYISGNICIERRIQIQYKGKVWGS